MAEVIDFASHRKPPTPPPSIEALSQTCIDEITGNWERFARNNRLNDYFLQSIPTWSAPNTDYMSDLNGVASVESKINLAPMILAPGTSESSKLGWIGAFMMNGVCIKCPVMVCEAYARCFNVLLFLKLGREMTQHGILIN